MGKAYPTTAVEASRDDSTRFVEQLVDMFIILSGTTTAQELTCAKNHRWPEGRNAMRTLVVRKATSNMLLH